MEPSLDRRRHADRRRHPTTLWSTLRWQGRRTSFRRAGEGHQAYVDGLAWRVMGLAVLVDVSSLLDALLTLRYLAAGGGEANPLMHLAITHSQTLFLALKIGLTGVAVWVLAAHQQWPLAVRGLSGLAFGYGAVLVYHLVLCVWLA
jgi:Domain of unknown function (DUF5658)